MPDDDRQIVIEPTEESFAADVIERSAELPVIVDFWAPWCGPCRMLTPILESLAAEFEGRVIVAKVNTEEHSALAGAFQIQSIPTVLAFRDRQLVDAFQGALPEQTIREWIQRLLPTAVERLVREAAQIEGSDPEQSRKLYQQALESDPQHVPARIGLTRVLVGLGDLEDAGRLISELEARGFLEPEAEKVRSQLHLLQAAKEGGGVEALRRAAQDDPQNLAVQIQLADALAAGGNSSEALDICLSIIPRDRSGVGQQAKSAMLDILNTLDDADLASEYRRKLASVLY